MSVTDETRIAAMTVTVKDETEISETEISAIVEYEMSVYLSTLVNARGFGIHIAPEGYSEETMAAIERGYRSIRITTQQFPICPPDANPLPPGWIGEAPGWRAIPGDWTAVPPAKSGGTRRNAYEVPPFPKFDVPVPNVDYVPLLTAPMFIPPGWKMVPIGWRVLPLGWSYFPRGQPVFPPTWRLYPDDWQFIPPNENK